MRGACFSNSGQYNEAITDYNTALNLSKTNIDKGWVHFDMAILYGRIGNEQKTHYHITTAARLGHEKAQQLCSKFGIPY